MISSRSFQSFSRSLASLNLRKDYLFCSLLLFLRTLFDFFVSCGANELTLQIVNVSLAIKKVLLIITLNLNASQAFLRQVFGIVDVNDIVFFVFFAILLGICLLLKSNQLALSQPIDVNIAVGLAVTDLLSIVILMDSVMILIGQLVDLVLNESILTRGLHHKF
jgi:hypothetical protein